MVAFARSRDVDRGGSRWVVAAWVDLGAEIRPGRDLGVTLSHQGVAFTDGPRWRNLGVGDQLVGPADRLGAISGAELLVAGRVDGLNHSAMGLLGISNSLDGSSRDGFDVRQLRRTGLCRQ